MSERVKIAAALAVIAMIALVIVWRTRAALAEVEGDAMVDADVGSIITVELVRPSPVKYSAPEVIGYPDTPPAPHVRIGTMRVVDELPRLREKMGNPRSHHMKVHEKIVELNANAYVHERVDENAPGLGSNEGVLEEGIYLVHAGDVGDTARARFKGMACQVTWVTPGSPAEIGGLRVGDLLVDLDGAGLPERVEDGTDPCVPMAEATKAVAPNQPVRMEIIRMGQPQTLTLVRSGTKFGYGYQEVPVLTPEVLASLAQ